MQSHSLVFRNPPDLPTHRCGAALTSFTLRLLCQPPSLSTRVRIAVPLRLFVAPCSLPTTCCALVALTFPRVLSLLVQLIRPCPVCTTGPLWLLFGIIVSPFGTSPSWPTYLAHSLTFLCVLPFWTLSWTLSRKFSSTVHLFTLVVAPNPTHAQGSLSGGMMRATTLWLLATAHGVTFVALGLLRIRLVSASCVNSSTAQSVPQDPLLERVDLHKQAKCLKSLQDIARSVVAPLSLKVWSRRNQSKW